MIKSGTDFEEMSKITLTLDDGKMEVSRIEKIVVDEKYQQDEKVAQIVEQFQSKST